MSKLVRLLLALAILAAGTACFVYVWKPLGIVLIGIGAFVQPFTPYGAGGGLFGGGDGS